MVTYRTGLDSLTATTPSARDRCSVMVLVVNYRNLCLAKDWCWCQHQSNEGGDDHRGRWDQEEWKRTVWGQGRQWRGRILFWWGQPREWNGNDNDNGGIVIIVDIYLVQLHNCGVTLHFIITYTPGSGPGNASVIDHRLQFQEWRFIFRVLGPKNKLVHFWIYILDIHIVANQYHREIVAAWTSFSTPVQSRLSVMCDSQLFSTTTQHGSSHYFPVCPHDFHWETAPVTSSVESNQWYDEQQVEETSMVYSHW